MMGLENLSTWGSQEIDEFLRGDRAFVSRVINATDALAKLNQEDLENVVVAHFEARPDLSPDQIERIGNALCRIAWKIGREAS